MIMTSSPVLLPHAHTGSHPCSPALRPIPSTHTIPIPHSHNHPHFGLNSPRPVLQNTISAPVVQQGHSTGTSPRSYARAPTIRPYASPLCMRGCNKASAQLCGDAKKFAHLVVEQIQFAGKSGKGEMRVGSLGTSWEKERVELIVDVPVWSPGCFQDLSTLHALRDTTLAQTHSLLAFLLDSHGIAGTYRLLTRAPSGQSNKHGWGCVRLAPRPHPVLHQSRSINVASLGRSPPMFGRNRPSLLFDNLDEDDDEEEDEEMDGVMLRKGYMSGDEEAEEDTEQVVVREIERRGLKEGQAFLMTLHGQPALILT
ncbi:hypothetical protein M231_02500 [Tremella mesenterica]|uniref:Uncharacterized protein n=1 Tax=Tremella mesenterica TaxID=5217 RepID=A0A4Q1BQL3_TREME|nr:uncharacterized protein TREMEDRAFT_64609 [Tremella mesenterica DSM 1558]EIW67358.1 hypothetical protein TREMEDRAFT_64609 [Tremella mesenterica DSM 1558]RXK40226.1 hypothetical protein M231_02500 [Tremella mesenterica]